MSFMTMFKFFLKVIPAFYFAMIIWWLIMGLLLILAAGIAEMLGIVPTMEGEQVTIDIIRRYLNV